MKYCKLLIVCLTILLLSSCGNTRKQTIEDLIAGGSKERIQEKRDELLVQKEEIGSQLTMLQNALDKMTAEENGSHIFVSLLEVKDTVFEHFLELQATVKTKQNILLNAEMGGVLEKIHVNKGQQVKKGQLLASIEDGGISQQLSQLKIQTELAKTTFERQANLWEQKIGSEIQYLQAKSAYESQKSAVEQMQRQAAKARIYAPFSGIVDDVITDMGSVVSPGMPILRLVNLSDMYLEAEVPEQYIADVKKGTQAKVDISVLNEQLDTKVALVSNFINPANRSFRIEVKLPNPKREIKPNMTARVEIKDYQNNNAILLPLDVISENAEGEQFVFVAVPSSENQFVAERTVIVTGQAQHGFIEVLSGLKKGDKIIKEGARSVQQGQLVMTIL